MADRQAPCSVRILAHRGLATSTDENSLAAFRAALEAGVQWIETDVNTTADGVVMAIHDPDLARVAAVPGIVTEMTAAELAEVRLAHGETVPTMASALERFPDACFNIDIKDEASVEALPEVINRAEAWDRVLLASFSESRRRRAAKLLSEPVASSAGYGGIAAFRLVSALMPPRACSQVWPWVRRVLRRWIAPFEAMQVPVSQKLGPLTVPVADRRFVECAHACGLRVDVWTIDEPEDMRRLAGIGVDGIVTNRADLATEALAGT